MLTYKKQSVLWKNRFFLSLVSAAFLLCLFQGPISVGAAEGVVNLNTATAQELAKITGIGEKKGEAIVKYREENGAFKSVEDIQKVKGIGAKIFEKIKGSLTVVKETAAK